MKDYCTMKCDIDTCLVGTQQKKACDPFGVKTHSLREQVENGHMKIQTASAQSIGLLIIDLSKGMYRLYINAHAFTVAVSSFSNQCSFWKE